jgi:beta-N-acetylhexosaminidase
MTIPASYGPVLIDIEGLAITDIERDKIKHPNTGAVILFARNYADPKQLADLTRSIRVARDGPILIAVDQEGGRVQRFRDDFTRLPPARRFVDTPELAEAAGWIMAIELLAVGVDFSFAPVLDVDCGISTVIGDRAFSDNSEQVVYLAGLFRKGMKKAGMAATGKHFPGHGGVAADSHEALPIDERDFETLRKHDLVPFQRLILQGLEAIMPAHVVYARCDDKPAGFSRFWLQQILREKLQFKGAIFSDDLNMDGAAYAGSYAERAQLAQAAGCDMLLICNNPVAAENILDALPVTEDEARTRRLSKMQGRASITRAQLLNDKTWQNFHDRINTLIA